MNKRRARERGQAMIEFAIVLPILIVLTLGGIYLTLSYLHKLRMNGLAFMSARVAAVRSTDFEAADFVKKRYQQLSQQKWVNQIESTASTPTSEQARITLEKPAERLDLLANAMDILSGGGNQKPTVLYAQATLPREYWTLGSEARPRTRTLVDYRYQLRGSLPWLNLLDAIPERIFDTRQMAHTPGSSSANDQLLGLNPPNANLLEFYADRGWNQTDYRSHSEKENGQFARMQTLGSHFKAIQGGAALVGYLAEFSGFGTALKGVLGEVTEKLSVTVENTMSKVSSTLDQQTRTSFSESPVP